jgi:4'-phosphopantetheinyl transferase
MHGFRPASPARVADLLDTRHVHVWRLPHRPEQGRAPFRALVAGYLDVVPSAVVFRDAPGGRPYIAQPHGDLALNWSHSGKHAVLALGRCLPILGVDVESPRPRTRALALADRFFHPLERDDLAALPPAQREAAFLKLWTAKEAVLKALGEGLRFGLDRVVFRLRDDRLVPGPFAQAAGALADWHLERLDDALGHACVAWRGERREVAWFTLDGDDVELSGRA